MKLCQICDKNSRGEECVENVSGEEVKECGDW